MCFINVLYKCVYMCVYTSDVNDAELLMPRLLVFNAEPRISFSEKNEPEPSRDPSQTSPSRTETLAKRARDELRLFQNITESK